MNIENLISKVSIKKFLHGNQTLIFGVLDNKSERYQFIQNVLLRFNYLTCSKEDKGLVKRYLMRVTGYSCQQLTRLIRQYKEEGHIEWKPCRSNGFERQYGDQDIRLLFQIDELHDTPCAPVVKNLCERAHKIYGKIEYQNLASISVSHLYNLRATIGYQKQRRAFRVFSSGKTKQRKSQLKAQPGFIRIDTVYEEGKDKSNAGYHINAVDEVTKFEVVFCVEEINKNFLLPVLNELIDKFPFVVINFHPGNGSSNFSKKIVNFLQKLIVESSMSSARLFNDNALIESKNVYVFRKKPVSHKWIDLVNQFNLNYLYTYINFHRPCYFSKAIDGAKGKQTKVDEDKNIMTPYEKLKSLPLSEKYLKLGVTFESLDKVAIQISDNEAAKQLQIERRKLFSQLFEEDRKYACSRLFF